MDDQHTDGNAMAGLLSEVLAVDASSIVRRCHSCGADRPMADHRAYPGAGAVLRCPECEDVAVRVVTAGASLVVEPRGTFVVARAS